MKNINKIAKLITLLIIIIFSIILFTISLKIFNTFIDNILDNIKNKNYNYNYDFNYNMLYMEDCISSNKNKDNPNIFLSKINKIAEYTKLINIDMFSCIKKQDSYNPSTIKTIFQILAEDQNFDITNIKDSDIRETIFNQRNFKLGISNKSKRFIGCNEIEAEMFRFLYENKKEYLEKYNLLVQLMKDTNSIYHKFIKFINHIERHYVMSIEDKNFRFTNYNPYYMELIEEMHKNNYINYPYITRQGNEVKQIVIPQFRDCDSILNLKYESYKEIKDNIEILEDKFKLLKENNSIENKYELVNNKDSLIIDENKVIINENKLITNVTKDIKYRNKNRFKIITLYNQEIPFINEKILTYNPDNLGDLDELNEKIKIEKNKRDDIKNIFKYINENNEKIDYIVENNLNNEDLTLKDTNKSLALKAIEDYKRK